MRTEIDASRYLLYHAIAKCCDGQRFSVEAAEAKLKASEVAAFVSDENIQIHGGYGYVQEYEVERMYRDQRLCAIGEGTNEIQRLVIARQVLGR